MSAPKMRLGRTRRICGVALVVVGVWLGALSAWSYGRDGTVGAEGHGCEWTVSVTSGVVQVQLVRGDWEPITVYPTGPPSSGPWRWRSSFHQVQPRYRWWGWSWFRSASALGSNTFGAAPVWPFASAALCGGALLVRAGRRAGGAAGRCAKCGYDLRGLAAGAKCPECGDGGRS